MRVTAAQLRRLRVPFRRPVRTAQGVTSTKDLLLVRLTTDVGTGWGECAAPAQPLYTSEYTEGAAHALRNHLLPRLAGRDVSGAGLAALLAPVQGHPMAKAALELAVLDAELRATGVPLADHLGARAASVEAGVAVAIAASVEALLDLVAAAVAEGYRRVKLKVEPGWDVVPVRAVREHFGDHLLLQADANGSYRLEDAAHLAGLDPFGLVLIEQPLGADDLVGHAELARRIATPVCLDESITSAAAAATALALGAAGVVNVKPARVGGLAEAVRIHDLCRAAGVPVWCGGLFETGLGRAANLALAGLPGFSLPGDLSPPLRYLDADIVDPPLVAEGGRLAVPRRPGLGVEVDGAAVDELTVSVEEAAIGA
ncbi:MAG: o-succinylbenzoate synthase [Acidimicrobiales bacterium]